MGKENAMLEGAGVARKRVGEMLKVLGGKQVVFG